MSNDCDLPPTNLKVESITNNSATFSFDNLEDNTRVFELRAYLAGNLVPSNININAVGYAFAPMGSSTVTIGNLQSGTEYDFAIRALCDDEKISVPSSPVRAVIVPTLGNLSSKATYGFSVQTEVQFTVYPNPVLDKITIESTVSFDVISVYDIGGREIAFFKNQKVIDLSTFSPGVYFLSFKNEKKSDKILGVSKIVKE